MNRKPRRKPKKPNRIEHEFEANLGDIHVTLECISHPFPDEVHVAVYELENPVLITPKINGTPAGKILLGGTRGEVYRLLECLAQMPKIIAEERWYVKRS